MKNLRFLAVAASIVLLASCATMPLGTAPSVSPLVTENGVNQKYEVKGQAEGQAGHFTLFGNIPFGRTDIDEAIKIAVDKYNGNNLINAHFYRKEYFCLIGNYTAINVKGDVVKYTDNPVVIPNSSGNLSSSSIITPANEVKKDHIAGINFGSEGFSAEYGFMFPTSKTGIYGTASFGYKYLTNEYKTDFDGAQFTYTSEAQVIPLTGGVRLHPTEMFSHAAVDKINELSLVPYIGTGLGWYPVVYRTIDMEFPRNGYYGYNYNMDYRDDNDKVVLKYIGWYLNTGIDYGFSKNIFVGLNAKWHWSVMGDEWLNVEDDSRLSFANYGITVRFVK